MLKQIRIALLLLCFTLPLLGMAVYHSGKNIRTMSRGNYFFNNTRHNPNVERITLKFGNETNITLVQREGFWRVKEADDYFVSPAQMNNLINFINDTVIYRSDKLDKKEITQYLTNGLELTTFDNNGNILDSSFIAHKEENNLYHYATLGDGSYLYQLNGKIAISPMLMDWVQMPFLQLNENEIKSIITDNFTLYRQFSGDDLKSAETNEPVLNFQRLMNNLHILTATEVKHTVNFDVSAFQKKKHYDITLLSGLIFGIDIYYGNNEYWFNIKPDMASISDNSVSSLLERYRLLLDGWFFKIDPDSGLIISNFVL
ncbi:MAG: hypothetical protein J6K65_04595 [Alphaproteobacteria bacterium]|nr:hypothetical protein [Alphaproteobacteria bacterium]